MKIIQYFVKFKQLLNYGTILLFLKWTIKECTLELIWIIKKK